jgi:hypothetical protein
MSSPQKPENGMSRYLQHQWEARRNPLSVWTMLEFVKVFKDDWSDPQTMVEVPAWAFKYLKDVAEAFGAMAVSGEGEDKITPARALAEVPRVLGLARQGWNAFAAYRRDDLRENALLRLEVGGEKRAEVQRSLGLKHDRSLRRALRRARGANPD